LLINWEILMHEIYMLAVLFNASRRRAVEPTRDQRLRDEQAFYERHSAGRPRFRLPATLGPAVPAAVLVLAVILGLARLWSL
jgi:hypothetical protein